MEAAEAAVKVVLEVLVEKVELVDKVVQLLTQHMLEVAVLEVRWATLLCLTVVFLMEALVEQVTVPLLAVLM